MMREPNTVPIPAPVKNNSFSDSNTLKIIKSEGISYQAGRGLLVTNKQKQVTLKDQIT